jgi:hypothetical protein
LVKAEEPERKPRILDAARREGEGVISYLYFPIVVPHTMYENENIAANLLSI